MEQQSQLEQQTLLELPTLQALQDDEDLQVMMAGSSLIKMKSYWKTKRHFRLLSDSMTIIYRSNKGFFGQGGHTTIPVAELESVREGHQSEQFALPGIAEEFPENLCFTLVFQGRQQIMDLVAETPEEAQAWIRGVRKLIEKVANMGENESRDQWVWDWFQKAEKNADGRLEFKETQKLLHMMNIEMEEDATYRLFQIADRSASTGLEVDEFCMYKHSCSQSADSPTT